MVEDLGPQQWEKSQKFSPFEQKDYNGQTWKKTLENLKIQGVGALQEGPQVVGHGLMCYISGRRESEQIPNTVPIFRISWS